MKEFNHCAIAKEKVQHIKGMCEVKVQVSEGYTANNVKTVFSDDVGE